MRRRRETTNNTHSSRPIKQGVAEAGLRTTENGCGGSPRLPVSDGNGVDQPAAAATPQIKVQQRHIPVEDLLDWLGYFATEQGPRLINGTERLSVRSLTAIAEKLLGLPALGPRRPH